MSPVHLGLITENRGHKTEDSTPISDAGTQRSECLGSMVHLMWSCFVQKLWRGKCGVIKENEVFDCGVCGGT